jgi:uroporphyrinogen decarboxylase
LAPGCDLPYAVKPENLDVVTAIALDPYQKNIAMALPDVIDDDPFDDIVPPVYAEEKSVIVDVVTLDSAGCAPCTYMVRAAEEAARKSGVDVQVREHKITGRDGIGYMKKLGVTAIPSICVEGSERFASILPERGILESVIQAAAADKVTSV